MGDFRAKLANREMTALTPGAIPDEAKRAVGVLLVQQVKERFATQGESGGERWPRRNPLFSMGNDRAVLTGLTGELLESFRYEIDGNRIMVYSDSPYAHVHQLGTTGKGGVLEPIKPVKAKALWIPLTEKARKASLAMRIKRDGSSMAETPFNLKRGRIYKGMIQVLDKRYKPPRWKAGLPDFIFLSKVDVPPRRMLPTSDREQEAQMALIASFEDAS